MPYAGPGAARAVLIACVLLCSAGAAAGNNVLPANAALLFDHPHAREEVAATPDPHPADALTCTRYPDLMIRETGTDGAGPGPAFLVPQGAGVARAACVARPGEHSRKLDMVGFSLIGRKGPFLFFDETDGNGAEGFQILSLPSGRAVYADSYNAPGDGNFTSVSLDGTVLHLSYRRGYNGSCSVLKDGAACWSRLMAQGHFARAIAAQPPPVAACAAAYRAGQAPPDDPSMITYDVEMTLTPDGHVAVLHRGAVGCEPAP